jgi:hypothetical protein
VLCSCGANRQLIEAETEKIEASAARTEAAAAKAQAAAARAEQATVRAETAEARVAESLRSANEAAAASRVPAIPIQYYVYDLLTKARGERRGYGMYTYVLFGRDVGRSSRPIGQDISQRYRRLLKAIESASESTSEAGRPTLETNLFCIPALSRNGALTLANYNSKLSSIYRNDLTQRVRSESTRSKLLGSSGPFLVSIVRPLTRTPVGSDMLVFDLASMNAEDMDHVVDFYEQRVAKKGASDFDLFDHMQLELIKWKPLLKTAIEIAQLVESLP